MVKLIDANALLAKLKGTPRYFDLKHDIEEMPTVTEADIRAKAIEEFAEKCKSNILCQTFGLHPKQIDEIAEQLKRMRA